MEYLERLQSGLKRPKAGFYFVYFGCRASGASASETLI